MASSHNFYASSPTVILPPNPPAQLFASGPFAESDNNTMATDPIMPDSPMKHNCVAPDDSFGPTPGALAGRKRSRGDIYSSDETDELNDINARSSPSDLRAGSPHKSFVQASIANGSQPNGDDCQMALDSAPETKPPMVSRKSQRLDSSASSGDYLAQLVLPPQMREATIEPLIDEATRTLGISWVRMDSSEALQINRAAYAKWIQNYYSGLKDVSIWFENSAIPGYLVEATNVYRGQREYYIFSNDLVEARLVTSEPEQLIPRLKMLPALHLAAPGGCLRAGLDSPRAAVSSATSDGAPADDVFTQPPTGICAAHSMEMD